VKNWPRYKEFFENIPKLKILVRAFRTAISCKCLMGSYRPHPCKKTRRNCSQCDRITIFWSIALTTQKPPKEKYVARFLPMAKARNLNAYLMTSYRPHPHKKKRHNYLQWGGIKIFYICHFCSVLLKMAASHIFALNTSFLHYTRSQYIIPTLYIILCNTFTHFDSYNCVYITD
jgi:hypothetical protein